MCNTTIMYTIGLKRGECKHLGDSMYFQLNTLAYTSLCILYSSKFSCLPKNFVNTLKITQISIFDISQGEPMPTVQLHADINFREIFFLLIGCLITKFTKILCHENLELYGMCGLSYYT